MQKETQAGRSGSKALLLALLVLIVVLAAFVGYRYKTFAERSLRFPKGSKINNVACGGMTAGEALEALTEAYNDKEYLLKSGDELLLSLSKFGASYDIKKDLEKSLDKNFKNFVKNDLLLGYSKLKIPMKVKSFSPSFKRRVRQLEVFENKSQKPVKTRDAYVRLEKPDFKIVEEVYGNNIDYNAFLGLIASDIEEEKFELEFNAEDFYAQPRYKKDSPEILQRQEFCKEYLSQDIVYDFGSSTETIDVKPLSKMKKMGKDGEVKYDKKAIKNYALHLAMKHNTWGITRSFKTRYGKEIKVSGGDYGYVINQDKETDQLLKDLKANEDVRREPIYSQRAMFGNLDDDLTDTYVEINTKRQKLWLVENGKTVFESPVVTGSAKVDLETAEGVYAISYKERKAVLRGENSDGSSYESPVDYWMPFNGNIGMHDAPWKKAFGLKEFRRAPSHGCVNMPYKYAKKMFSRVKAGFPVVVYKD